jgi:hypothetical protein
MTNPRNTRADLENLGFALGALTEPQQQVLLDLSGEEMDLLLAIRARMDEAAPEVEAHGDIAGAALF